MSTGSASGTSRRQITVKVLYHDAIRYDPDAAARARQLELCGARVRTTAAQIPAIVISDREIAVIFKNPADPEAATIWTNQPAIIAALAVLFEQAWNAAVPLGSSRPGATAGRAALDLTTTERDLLNLLADGATDEAAARRHVATLMTCLNAISRFQAGAEAARRGWLG